MIRNSAFSIGTSPVALSIGDSITADGMTLWIHNHDHQNKHEVYLGDVNVTASTGFGVGGEATVGPIGLIPGEVIYAISEQAGGVPIRVFATRT